ncbi:MAG: cation diffusion facilitator family transporter [Candidatus Cryptobacteroides sp.]|nr:cation diffusion facilitator family transporter [Candidatus Cryptobacteroides sp.]
MLNDREKQIRDITLWGSLVNVVLTICKIVAGILGRSAAMVADGIHSLSDLMSDVVILIFVHLSSKERDCDHDFGHGKYETLATVIVSLILLVVGAELMAGGVKSIISIANGETVANPGWIALIAAVVSILAKEGIYQATMAVSRKVESQALVANAWHHRSDALSSIGSLLGIGGAMLLGNKWSMLDPIASCLISIAIIVIAVKMSIPCIKDLLEASLPEDVEQRIISLAKSVEGVNDIHELKTRKNGSSKIIDAHIVVDPEISITKAHDIATEVEQQLIKEFGPQTQISLHMEPDKDSK